MHILIIIPTLSVAGAEKFIIDLSNNLSKNCRVTIINLFSSENDFLSQKILPNVTHIDLSNSSNNRFIKPLILLEAVKRINPDVVHTHLSALIYLTPYLFLSNKKVFHTIHNLAKSEAPKLNRFINKCLIRLFSVKLISISEEVNNSVLDEYNCTPIKIENGATKIEKTNEYDGTVTHINKLKSELEFKTGRKCQKVLVSIARIDPQKNHELLIKSMPTDGSVLVLLFGHCSKKENEYTKKVFSLVHDNEHVNYLGVKNNISDYIIASDAIVFSSNYEGLPISLLESMSAGKPCISTPAGGIPDVVIDTITGFISSDFTPSQLSAAVKKYLLLTDEENAIMSHNASIEFEKNYSMDICANKHLQTYQSL